MSRTPKTRSTRTAVVGTSVLIGHASALLQVSRRTIYYWIQAGRLRTIRTVGGSQRVLLDDIHRLIGPENTA